MKQIGITKDHVKILKVGLEAERIRKELGSKEQGFKQIHNYIKEVIIARNDANMDHCNFQHKNYQKYAKWKIMLVTLEKLLGDIDKEK